MNFILLDNLRHGSRCAKQKSGASSGDCQSQWTFTWRINNLSSLLLLKMHKIQELHRNVYQSFHIQKIRLTQNCAVMTSIIDPATIPNQPASRVVTVSQYWALHPLLVIEETQHVCLVYSSRPITVAERVKFPQTVIFPDDKTGKELKHLIWYPVIMI